MSIDCCPVRAWAGSVAPLHYTRATELIRPMPGSTQPYLVRCEDNEYYVAKSARHSSNPRVLANELFAAQLATLIGLPVCNVAVVEVPFGLTEVRCEAQQVEGWKSRLPPPGLQFGSRYPGRSSEVLAVDFLPDTLLRRVTNLRSAFLGGFVVDIWTCNCGRREAVFIRRATPEVPNYSAMLIDFGACFNDGNWECRDMSIPRIYPRRAVYQAVSGPDSFEPYLSRIESLKAYQIEECAQNVPAAWCGHDPGKISVLAQALLERRNEIRRIVANIMKSGRML